MAGLPREGCSVIFISALENYRMESFMKMKLFCLSACTILMLSYGCASHQNSLTKLEGQDICQETKSDRMWQLGKGGEFFSLEEAQKYAASLQLGGYTDWRVPTWEESFKLHNIFLLKNNNDCAMDFDGDFWSVSAGNKPTLGHWEIYFLCGDELRYEESHGIEGYVRAVRP